MFNLETRLASLVTSSSEAVIQAHSIREQLDKLQASGATADAIAAFKKKLKTLTEGSGQSAATEAELTLNRVNGQASTLYGEVYRADATPTVAQLDAAKTAEQDAATILKQWEIFKTSELANMNKVLRNAGLPEIRLEANPQTAADQGDEE